MPEGWSPVGWPIVQQKPQGGLFGEEPFHVAGGVVDGEAAAHGYSRAAFYLIAAGFEERGMAGLVDERPGRRGPVKLNEEIVGFLREADPILSGAVLARRVEERFGISLHRRTVERARRP